MTFNTVLHTSSGLHFRVPTRKLTGHVVGQHPYVVSLLNGDS